MRKVAQLKDRVAEVVETSGLKQYELAAKVGVASPTISWWKSTGSIREDHKIALCVKCSINPLWIEGYDVPKHMLMLPAIKTGLIEVKDYKVVAILEETTDCRVVNIEEEN